MNNEKFLNNSGLSHYDTKIKQVINGKVGDLTQLTTSSKTDLVGAVNEVFSSIPNIDNNLNTNSGNPVQNKVITTRLNSMTTSINGKQATLVSGTNIKTVDGQSLLGSGNIPLPTIVGSNWGVAKTGSVNATTTGVSVSISNLNLSSINDYQVALSIEGELGSSNNRAYVHKVSNTTFNIVSSSASITVYYTVVAKGFGSVPKGGSTGQVLAKKSSADGDVEWVTGGGGGGTGNVDQTYDPTSVNAQSGKAVAEAVAGVQSNLDATNDTIGDLTSLTTTTKTDIVSAINDVDFAVKNIGEPFRVVNWSSNTLNVTIVPCTSDAGNTSLEKMIFSIDNATGAEYQIVGMIAYEVFDAASGGNRVNCWPVCQFTGNGQKELSVRWMCGGTTNKVAKRINAWVLLKHR